LKPVKGILKGFFNPAQGWTVALLSRDGSTLGCHEKMSPTLKVVASITRPPFRLPKTIRELGGTMPENLPTAESIRMVERREKKRLKAEQKRALPDPPPAG